MIMKISLRRLGLIWANPWANPWNKPWAKPWANPRANPWANPCVNPSQLWLSKAYAGAKRLVPSEEFELQPRLFYGNKDRFNPINFNVWYSPQGSHPNMQTMKGRVLSDLKKVQKSGIIRETLKNNITKWPRIWETEKYWEISRTLFDLSFMDFIFSGTIPGPNTFRKPH